MTVTNYPPKKPIFYKDSDATLDYTVDWAGGWLNDGEAINVSNWTVPAPLVATNEAFAGGIATVWLSGGVAGQNYEVTNRITTNQSRVDERTLVISVINR